MARQDPGPKAKKVLTGVGRVVVHPPHVRTKRVRIDFRCNNGHITGHVHAAQAQLEGRHGGLAHLWLATCEAYLAYDCFTCTRIARGERAARDRVRAILSLADMVPRYKTLKERADEVRAAEAEAARKAADMEYGLRWRARSGKSRKRDSRGGGRPAPAHGAVADPKKAQR